MHRRHGKHIGDLVSTGDHRESRTRQRRPGRHKRPGMQRRPNRRPCKHKRTGMQIGDQKDKPCKDTR